MPSFRPCLSRRLAVVASLLPTTSFAPPLAARCAIKQRRVFLVIASLALVLGWAPGAFAQSKGDLDWKVQSLYVKPQPAIAGSVTVGCTWKADVVGSFQWQKQISVETRIVVSDGELSGKVWPSITQMASTWYQPNGKLYTPGTATSEFNGTREWTVTLYAGSHTMSCTLDFWDSSPSSIDNYKEITFDVLIPKVDFSQEPAGGEKVKATSPVVPGAGSSQEQPGGEKAKATTPVIPGAGITPGSPSPSRSRPADQSGSQLRLPKSGTPLANSRALPPQAAASKPYVFRLGEKLLLQDGRALTKDGTALVLLDRNGAILKSYPEGAEVFVREAGEVSVQRGPVSELLGLVKRN